MAAQTVLSAFGRASIVDYRVDAGTGVERFSGATVGVEAVLQRGSRLAVGVVALSGLLQTDARGEPDRTVGEVGVSARLLLAPWLALSTGAAARSLATELARQRWMMVTVAAEARPRFTGGALSGIFRGGLAPVVSVGGLPHPELAVVGAAGLGYRRDRLTVEVVYALERYDFPPEGGVARAEQLATLTVRAGVRAR